MGELFDIFGYVSQNDPHQFVDNWVGKVFMNNNNRFEGIAKSCRGKTFYYIFGKKTDNGLVSITRCNVGGDPSFAFRYKARAVSDNKYQGIFGIKSETDCFKLGECSISLHRAEKTRDITSFELENLKSSMATCNMYLSDYQRKLYNTFKGIKKTSSKVKIK